MAGHKTKLKLSHRQPSLMRSHRKRKLYIAVGRVSCADIKCGPKDNCLVDLQTRQPRCVSCRYKCPRKQQRPVSSSFLRMKCSTNSWSMGSTGTQNMRLQQPYIQLVVRDAQELLRIPLLHRRQVAGKLLEDWMHLPSALAYGIM